MDVKIESVEEASKRYHEKMASGELDKKIEAIEERLNAMDFVVGRILECLQVAEKKERTKRWIK